MSDAWYEILQDKMEKSKKNIKDLQYIFYVTAQQIMNQYTLKIDSIEFELTEIEFYYFDCENHSDIYVHQNELQKTTRNFLYAHENSWGNYGGIDLTFGNGSYYGGILIRGIKLDDNFIAGPATLRNKIVEIINQNINSYTKFQNYLNSKKNLIGLQKKSHIQEEHPILISTRINLGKKESPNYRNALYRFVREDMLIAKQNKEFATKDNLKETSMLKAISKMVIGYECNEPSTTKKIENNEILSKNIENLAKQL